METQAARDSLSLQSVVKLLPADYTQSQEAPGAAVSHGGVSDQRLVDAALGLARVLQQRAAALQTPQERRQQAELDRMLQHPEAGSYTNLTLPTNREVENAVGA